MAHKSSVDKAREQAQAQKLKAEKYKHSVEFEMQEARRIQAEQLTAEKEEIKAKGKRNFEELSQKLSDKKNKHLKEQTQSDLLYAKSESLRVSIGLSLVIIFIIYFLVF